MKTWTKEQIEELKDIITFMLSNSVGESDMAQDIAEIIVLEVAKDITETAGYSFNDSDVRLAIGRVIKSKLNK